MFEVTAAETIALAAGGVHCLVNTVTPSTQANNPDVSWSRLAFRRTYLRSGPQSRVSKGGPQTQSVADRSRHRATRSSSG